MCCKIMRNVELGKPPGVWCTHVANNSCSIYATKPRECTVFYCNYLRYAHLPEEWKPSVSKIVLVDELGGKRLTAYVDPGRPDAWRQHPYYAVLKFWAHNAVKNRGEVMAVVAGHTYMILPDRDVDLGVLGDDDVIVTVERSTKFGVTHDVMKMHKDDPRAVAIMAKKKAEAEAAAAAPQTT